MSFKLFISYAHEDESFKKEFIEHLNSFGPGLIDPWDDSLIEVGSKWREAIQNAMNDCQLGVLLLSKSFLASEFIRSEELPKLITMQDEGRIKLLPILLKQCGWKHTLLKDLQILPNADQAIASFDNENGERDEEWVQILDHVEKWAKAHHEAKNKVEIGDIFKDEERYHSLVGLAKSIDLQVRKNAAKHIIEYYVNEKKPEEKAALIKKLLNEESKEVRRTTLSAINYLKNEAHNFYVWIAQTTNQVLRQEAKDTLYVIWKRDPTFTYAILSRLIDSISLEHINVLNFKSAGKKIIASIEFFIELTVLIYINHCESEEVINHSSDYYFRLSTEKLHINKIPAIFIKFIALLPQHRAFSKPILNILLLSEYQPSEKFFNLPLAGRACLERISLKLDPQSDISSIEDDIAIMLESDILVFNRSAALVMAIHAYKNYGKVAHLYRQLINQLSPSGKLWLLFSFAVLLPETPKEWREPIELLTYQLVNTDFEALAKYQPELIADFDFLFIPLGLYYGKDGAVQSISLLEAFIREGIIEDNKYKIIRCLKALGPIGIYYPDIALNTLRRIYPELIRFDYLNPIHKELVYALASIRNLYSDEVDKLMLELNLNDAVKLEVSDKTDISAITKYLSWLGHFNNAVHLSAHYPNMRKTFTMNELTILATAKSPSEFIERHSVGAFELAKSSQFRLIEWTRPE